MSRLPKNYRWWQEHGGIWSDEVSARKAHMPIYHLQEIFLEEYFSQVAPAKVLEFGCGFGRHLEYLRRIRKLDVHGFDQSESMVKGMRWARKPWREKHITVGEPLERLPFADGEFDVVFTVSVLIHVRPQDLDHILSELHRVSSGHIVHIENLDVSETIVTSDAHDGCWAHDLRLAWSRIAPDATLEVAPSLFDIEDVYRVLDAGVDAPPLISKSRAARFRQLDDAISGEIGRLREVAKQSEGQATRRAGESDQLRSRLDDALSALTDARADEAEQRERSRSAEAKHEELLQRLATYRNRVESIEADLVQARNDGGQQRDRAKLAEDRSQDNLDRARKAEEQAAGLLARANEAETRVEALLERASAAEARIEPLLDRATRAESTLGQAEQSLEEARAIIDARATQLAELRTKLSTENDVQRARAREAEASSELLRVRARDAETATQQLRARVRDAEAAVEPLRVRARDAESARATLTDEVSTLRSRARAAEEKLATALSSLAEARRAGLQETNRLASELSEFTDRVTSLNERIDNDREELRAVGVELRGAKGREATALLRATELIERLDGETARADDLAAVVMRSHNAQERLIGQERDAQSRLIALRRRAERAEREIVDLRGRAVDAEGRVDDMRARAEAAEAKSESQRSRAREAEAEIAMLHEKVRELGNDWALERRRADEALGTIDAARRGQETSERELAALRATLNLLVD